MQSVMSSHVLALGPITGFIVTVGQKVPVNRSQAHQTPREVFCICLLRHLPNSFSCSRAALRRTEYSPTTPSQPAPAGAIASLVFTGAGR